MENTLLEQFVSTDEGMRRFQQERAISAVTGLIRRALDEQGLRRAELAAKLGKTKGWVTQLLDGEGNKTIRTVADVLAVLGLELRVSCGPIRIGSAAQLTKINGRESRTQKTRRREPTAPARQKR